MQQSREGPRWPWFSRTSRWLFSLSFQQLWDFTIIERWNLIRPSQSTWASDSTDKVRVWPGTAEASPLISEVRESYFQVLCHKGKTPKSHAFIFNLEYRDSSYAAAKECWQTEHPATTGGISNSCSVRAVKHAKKQAVTGRRAMTEINKWASKTVLVNSGTFGDKIAENNEQEIWDGLQRSVILQRELWHAASVLTFLARKVSILVKPKPLNHQQRLTRLCAQTHTSTHWLTKQGRSLSLVVLHPYKPIPDSRLIRDYRPACLSAGALCLWKRLKMGHMGKSLPARSLSLHRASVG